MSEPSGDVTWSQVLSSERFARRLARLLEESDCRVVWFLGAGCSISSGIPGASDLVREWTRRLMAEEGLLSENWEDWAGEQFREFDPSNPACLYGIVMNELFPMDRERQQEIERLTSSKDPAIGYALLAVLMAHPRIGPRANVVLTVNFDDLVADALYLTSRLKPLIVMHESLADYARTSRGRPLIVKIHGDAQLDPRNTPSETSTVAPLLAQRIHDIFRDCTLVFCGYSGNDKSIAQLVRDAPEDAFPGGVYWIGSNPPAAPLSEVLAERKGVFHVTSGDFDAQMLSIAGVLDLSLPGFDRWQNLFDGYSAALSVEAASAREEHDGTRRAVAERLRNEIGAWQLEAQARALRATDPSGADEAYTKATEMSPDNAGILGNYGNFLANVLKDVDRAEAMYERALTADPNIADILGNYGNFLANVRKDADRAEAMYERALTADCDHTGILGNYALFLRNVRKDADRAEAMYERALAVEREDADLDNGSNLGHYAKFLAVDRKDADRAEAMYERALAVDPNSAGILGSYAQFLFSQRHGSEAEGICRSLAARDDLPGPLRLEIGFYLYLHCHDTSAGCEMVTLLFDGVRSQGWDLSGNLAVALRETGVESPYWQALAEVVGDAASIQSLDNHAEWLVLREMCAALSP